MHKVINLTLLHVLVLIDIVVMVVLVESVVVVLSSRHPHQPADLHVSVCAREDVVGTVIDVIDDLVRVLFSNI
jgi:hypothetical protein